MPPAPTTAAEGPPLGGAASGPLWRRPSTWLWVVLLLEAIATLVDIGAGPWSVVGFEEGRNARAALHLACGHADRLLHLQYRDFCGGCTGVAIVGAPLLRVLGDSVATWKLVPAAFHLGLVAVSARILTRAAQPLAAIVAVGLFAASPWALRELALTGWGNHAEVRVGVLAAAALLLSSKRPHLTAAAAGLLTGLSVWFAHIAVFAVPALLLLALRRGRSALSFVVATPVGMLPWFAYLHARPTAIDGARQMWGQAHLASPTSLAHFLTGPFMPAVLWPATHTPALDLLLATSVVLAVLGAAAGTIATLRTRHPLGAFLLLAGAGFITALVIRPDLWADVPPDPGFSAFHLRYRAVLWPLVPLGVGLLVQVRPRSGLAAALPLLVCGLAARGYAWTLGPGPTLHASVWSAPGRPDATVPEGTPPRRTPWALDRPVDITAAQAFLDSHTDPIPACRTDHAGELGRRIGLHVRRGGSPTLPEGPSPAIAAGVAWGLHAPAGRLPERPPGHLPDSWAGPVQVALGRHTGSCLGQADDAVDAATDGNRRRATTPPPSAPTGCEDDWNTLLATVSAERGTCPLAPGWPDCGALSASR